MGSFYVVPRSRVETLRKRRVLKMPEDNSGRVERMVKAGRGDTYRLMMIRKNIKAML